MKTMKLMYIDNSIMRRIFKKNDSDFYQNFNTQIVKQNRTLRTTQASMGELYGISHRSIAREFTIDFAKIDKQIRELSDSDIDARDFFDQTNTMYIEFIKEKINGEKVFKDYIMTRIQKTSEKIKENASNEIIKIYTSLETHYVQRVKDYDNYLQDLLFDQSFRYNFMRLENMKKKTNEFKKTLAVRIEEALYEFVLEGFSPPVLQMFKCACNIRNSLAGEDKERIKYSIKAINTLGIKLNYDSMDSELILCFIFGDFLNKQKNKPIHCYTMDSFTETKDRVTHTLCIFKDIHSGIERSVKEHGCLPGGWKRLLHPNFGIIDCLTYKDGIFTKETYKTNALKEVKSL